MLDTLLGRLLGKRAASSQPAPISILPSQDFDGNDGPWSSFPIQIGTPPQTVKVLISTSGSQTLAVLSDGCTNSDPANCTIARGGIFNPGTSSTWHQNQDVAGGLAPLNLDFSGPNDTGLYGSDHLILGGEGSNGPSLDGQVVAGIATKKFYLGSLGLSPRTTSLPETSAPLIGFMSSLNSSGSIPSLSWSYTTGNHYRPGPVYGDLILGGYDSSRFEPNDVIFTFNDTDPRDFAVNIGAIYLTDPDQFVTILLTENESTPAYIDSTSPYITLPKNICEQFEVAFGITWDENVQGYLVNDTLHDYLQNQNTSIVFNLGNSTTVPGQGFNISFPYSAFDLTASPPLLKNTSRYFPLIRAKNDSQVTLGRTFLQEAYLTANYEHNNFSVSQCTWDTEAKPHIVPIQGKLRLENHGSNKLSAGAIVGIVIGVVVGLILLALLAFTLWKRKRRQQQQRQEPKPVNIAPVELDSPEKDPYTMMANDMNKGPLSPELAATEHKGHELDSPHSPKDPGTPAPTYELDATAATDRQSRTLSTPISYFSRRSASKRLHDRQMSDPISLNSELSESSQGSRLPELSSGVVSPARQKSDPTRLHRREQSDPVSISGVTDADRGALSASPTSQSPISPVVQKPDADPISAVSEGSPVSPKDGGLKPSQSAIHARKGSGVTKFLETGFLDSGNMAGPSGAPPKGHEHKISDPISPTSERGHERNESDPVSMLSERPEQRMSNL